MFDVAYTRQAELLLGCLPQVARQSRFGLKGGTAINLFCRQMPRLSVDIDLTFLPLSGRDEALEEIGESLALMARDIENHVAGTRVAVADVGGTPGKLLVRQENAQVKIEPNLVLRGAVFPPEQRDLCDAAQKRFDMFVSVQSLSFADLYGGKICAALDRQHPRDLFDVHMLLQHEGLPSETRRAFVVYLAGHPRPMHELLDPRFKDLGEDYEGQFIGMVDDEVPLEALYETRERLVALLRRDLDEDERLFLLSLKRGEPEWDVLGIPHLRDLPALQWKLKNIRRMSISKRANAVRKLELVLQL